MQCNPNRLWKIRIALLALFILVTIYHYTTAMVFRIIGHCISSWLKFGAIETKGYKAIHYSY